MGIQVCAFHGRFIGHCPACGPLQAVQATQSNQQLLQGVLNPNPHLRFCARHQTMWSPGPIECPKCQDEARQNKTLVESLEDLRKENYAQADIIWKLREELKRKDILMVEQTKLLAIDLKHHCENNKQLADLIEELRLENEKLKQNQFVCHNCRVLKNEFDYIQRTNVELTQRLYRIQAISSIDQDAKVRG